MFLEKEYKTYKKFFPAFTLAEVLITLVVIGVIAAITISAIINQTYKQEFVSKLKKAYSAISLATNLIIAEEGLPESGWALTDGIYQLYKVKLVNAKECGYNTGCFEQHNTTGTGYKHLRGYDSDTTNYNTLYKNKLILADGVQVMFYPGSSCDNNWINDTFCARIMVDINGMKKPNTFGRDVFIFAINRNGLFPMGCNYSCEAKTSNGYGCACRVLRENGMNY